MEVDSTGHMEGVYAAFLFQVSGHSSCVLNGLAAFHFIAGVDTTEDGQVAASLPTDVFDDEAGQTHPVFKASAEFIHTLIGAWGHKRAYQISMRHVDLYSIHTGFHCSSCCLSVAFYQFIHFFGR